MFAKINCAGLFGVQGFHAEAEADSSTGIPGFYLTGALSPETKEAQYRVSTAIRNSGIRMSPRKVTVNLAPASRRKEGTAFDLAVAMAVLLSGEAVQKEGFPFLTENFLSKTAFLGELGLDGRLKPVLGVLPMADALKKAGMERLIVPKQNVKEAALVPGIAVYGAESLSVLLSCLKSDGRFPEEIPQETSEETEDLESDVDFSEVRGQAYLKRAAEIAVSGRHNLLLSGAAGSGKTMIAKRIPTIMPELSRQEQIELSKLYSICGLLPAHRPLMQKRPFRSPHHASTTASLLGGGNTVRPGEVSLASKGVLFLDELPLFRREAIEALREPLEERRVVITRLKGVYEFPADFCLVAACNNCPCGFYPDLSRCRCTKAQIRMYQGHLSRPILERIDICAEARPVSFEEMQKGETGECSGTIRERVEAVYEIQKKRFADCQRTRWNSEMTPSELERFCSLSEEADHFMRRVFAAKGLSVRTYHKVLRVARTIADMAGSRTVEIPHLSEAVGLRSFEDRLWGGVRENHK